jgi:hypothetical protein
MVNLNALAPSLVIFNNGLLLVTPVGGPLTFQQTFQSGAFAFR